MFVTILMVLIQLSIFLTVLSFGMMAGWDDIVYLFRRPGQLIKSVLSISIIMPIVALLMALFFDLGPAVEVALVALAVSPVPPMLPGTTLKAGGSRECTFGLMAAISLLSIVTIPVVLTIFDQLAPGEAKFSTSSIFATVVSSLVIPIALGMVIRRFAPEFSERNAGKINKIAMAVLILSFLPILIFGLLPVLWSVFSLPTILAIVVFTLIGITVGHFLGGPEPGDRTALALSTAARHPGIAVALAIANIGQTEAVQAIAVVLLYVLVSGMVATPYFNWLRGNKLEGENLPAGKVA